MTNCRTTYQVNYAFKNITDKEQSDGKAKWGTWWWLSLAFFVLLRVCSWAFLPFPGPLLSGQHERQITLKHSLHPVHAQSLQWLPIFYLLTYKHPVPHTLGDSCMRGRNASVVSAEPEGLLLFLTSHSSSPPSHPPLTPPYSLPWVNSSQPSSKHWLHSDQEGQKTAEEMIHGLARHLPLQPAVALWAPVLLLKQLYATELRLPPGLQHAALD